MFPRLTLDDLRFTCATRFPYELYILHTFVLEKEKSAVPEGRAPEWFGTAPLVSNFSP